MRVLAIDFGTKRIGTAVSDALGISIRPVETIMRSSNRRDIARLKALVEELEAEAVVIGLPLRMDGAEGDAARKVKRFARSLQSQIGVEVITHDERLTSYEAEQIMAERGLSRRERRAQSDTVAATIILRDFLSTPRSKN